ncbi:MAG: ABC transporter substrate-binding protein [Chloroflexi bacterium]|nr:ABC transporter substrate-binding protein [Chloroflexota bacterium]
MMHRGSLSTMVSVGAFLAMLLSACAPAAAPSPPAPAPAAPGAPAPTAVPRATPPPVAPAAAPAAPAAEKPQYGGTLALTLNADIPSLDFNAETTMNVWEPGRASVESLVRRNAWKPDVPIVGHLAEKWDMSADGTTFTFTLAKGATWHDGSPFTSQDVKFTFERYLNPPAGVRSVIVTQLQPIKEMQVVNDTTFKMVLRQPKGSMLDRLSGIPVYSKKWTEAGGDPQRDMMGTGPFKFKAYTPGTSWEFVKYPNYWQKGKPYLDGLIWYIINDRATRFAALRTGRAKVASSYFSQISPTEKEQMEKDKLPVQTWPSYVQLTPYMEFNLKQKPYDDVRVRRAIHLATDRAQARQTVLEKAGRPGFWFTYRQPPGIGLDELLKMPGFREDPKLKEQDIAGAKKLMADAGFPNGFKAVVTTRTLDSFKKQAIFMASEVSKIGIQATVDVVEDAAIWPKLRRGEFQMAQLNATSLRIDPSDETDLWLLPKGGLNFHPFEDAEFVKAYNEQDKLLDPAARTPILRKMEQRLIDEMPGIHLGWSYGFIMVWNEVKNWPQYDRGFEAGVLSDIWMTK